MDYGEPTPPLPGRQRRALSARAWVVIAGSILLAAVLALSIWSHVFMPARTAGPLPQQAYLWQRAWTEDVRTSVQRAGGAFERLVVLAAEVGWEHGRMRAVRVPVDYARLCNAGVPTGLALRIDPYAGPFAETGEPAGLLAELAASLVSEAEAAGLTVGELQIDFDCAESKLAGYRLWINAIRRRIGAVPLTITVLPSWLKRSEFPPLVAATDGFVLQVHSLERPASVNAPMSLCDPQTAQRAVERAAWAGVPFRVALPTYGYFVAFDGDGRFVGIEAEGPALTWPDNVQIRVLRADPTDMSALVRTWTADRPANLRGIIWYRLPADADKLNWRWATLAAAMDGHKPRAKLEADTRRPEPGLAELDLLNTGDADSPLPATVTVGWNRPPTGRPQTGPSTTDTDARLIAGDALAGFDLVEVGGQTVEFRATRSSALEWLAPGQRRPVGWLRFSVDTEVEVHVSPVQP